MKNRQQRSGPVFLELRQLPRAIQRRPKRILVNRPLSKFDIARCESLDLQAALLYLSPPFKYARTRPNSLHRGGVQIESKTALTSLNDR